MFQSYGKAKQISAKEEKDRKNKELTDARRKARESLEAKKPPPRFGSQFGENEIVVDESDPKEAQRNSQLNNTTTN